MSCGKLARERIWQLREYKDIIKLGHPYVIEFSSPFSWIDFFEQQDVARYMLEEWIYLDIKHDEPRHQYHGRIEKEIPPEKIINFHEVEDDFKDMDNWLFKYDAEPAYIKKADEQ